MALISDYFRELQQYIAKYGKNTILLSQQGNFYECYGFDPRKTENIDQRTNFYQEVWNQPLGFYALSHPVEELENLMRADQVCKNKSLPHSLKDNPSMIGFPTTNYDRRKNSLLAAGYTIVRKDEVKPNKNNPKEVKRVVAEIVSPYTELDTESSKPKTVAVLYLEYQKGEVADLMEVMAGLALLDCVTGTGRIAEFYSLPEDSHLAIQQVYRVLTSHRPREVVVHLVDFPKPLEYLTCLENTLESHRYDRWIPYVDHVGAQVHKKSYHVEFFNTLFPPTPAQDQVVQVTDPRILEKLGLDGMVVARTSYILLIQHYQEFTSGVTSALRPPEVAWIDADTHLVLVHNAVSQLNVLENPRDARATLFHVLNKTKTRLGERRLRHLLLHPITNVSQLTESYNIVQELIENPKPLGQLLSVLPDFERLHRKLVIGLISPRELKLLYTGYTSLIKLYGEVKGYSHLQAHLLKTDTIFQFNTWLTRFSYQVNWDALADCVAGSLEDGTRYLNFKTWPLPQVLATEVRELEQALLTLEQYVDHLNQVSDAGIKMEQQKKVGGSKKLLPLVISVTDSRSKKLLKAEVSPQLGQITLSKDTESRKLLHSPVLDQLLDFVEQRKAALRVLLPQHWRSLVQQMQEYNFYREIDRMVAAIDLWYSFAQQAVTAGYFRPEIDDSPGNSYLEATEIRHPIIETLLKETGMYVTNDVTLRGDGILLYGLNQVGKSSLGKALPLNVILAQIGSFTAGKLKLRLYSKIITRLIGGDDMSQGESTYKLEMSELRTILRQADAKTLVIGDELAHSTDVYSASAIVVSAVVSLSDLGSSFIFATHLHDILELQEIEELINRERVRVMHLSTAKGQFGPVYNRKLAPGSGDPNYGVVVAESLGMPSDFIERAYSILGRLTKKRRVVDEKTSRYNKQVHVTACALCRKNDGLQTHHIEEQHLAGLSGLIKSDKGLLYKHAKNNLIVLCDGCHEKVHAGAGLKSLDTAMGRVVVKEE